MRRLPAPVQRAFLLSAVLSLACALLAAPQAYAQAGSIQLIQCSGKAAKWAGSTVTYRIVDVAGTGAAADVQAAIARWNNAQNVYDLQSAAGDENIRIEWTAQQERRAGPAGPPVFVGPSQN